MGSIQLGENAVKISGGQKQRIGIARALYPNPEFLIMDESTNALDQLTEESIIRTIFGMKDIKNIICISHKMSNLKFCDKVWRYLITRYYYDEYKQKRIFINF